MSGLLINCCKLLVYVFFVFVVFCLLVVDSWFDVVCRVRAWFVCVFGVCCMLYVAFLFVLSCVVCCLLFVV